MNEEKLIRLAQLSNHRLTNAEAATFAREFRQRFVDMNDLMTSRDVNRMRRVVSNVERLIRDLRSVMCDKEVCHFFSAIYGGFSGIGLLAVANPFGAVAFGGFLIASLGFGIGAAMNGDKITDKIRQIQRTIETDRSDFRLVATAIRRLDSVCERYLNVSLFSEGNREFLRSAAEYVVIDKYFCATRNDDRILQVLKSLAIAESLGQFYALISGCAAFSSTSAMVPFLSAAFQTLLFIKDVNDNEDTMRKLKEGVDAMRKKCDALDVLYK